MTDPERITGLSALEGQVLQERAKGLSDLEIALKLCIYEREVRAITQKLKRHALNAKMTPPLAV